MIYFAMLKREFVYVTRGKPQPARVGDFETGAGWGSERGVHAAGLDHPSILLAVHSRSSHL